MVGVVAGVVGVVGVGVWVGVGVVAVAVAVAVAVVVVGGGGVVVGSTGGVARDFSSATYCKSQHVGHVTSNSSHVYQDIWLSAGSKLYLCSLSCHQCIAAL